MAKPLSAQRKRCPRPGSLRTWLAAVGLVIFGCGPDIPHPVNSTADNYCRTCHDGRAGAPASGHEDRTGCADCHGVQDWSPFPALMPHPGGDETRCYLCHEDGTFDAKATTHMAESRCYACHQAPDYLPWPSSIPHAVAATDAPACLVCHTDIDHKERDSCTTCHAM